MITIGQLADYAGVTVKAIRHYHERGLLPEPDRDSSGYRRYTAKDAIDLVKIRTLAHAGVPLARIKDLLDADPDTLTAAIAEIDHDLQDRITQLRRTRDQLAQLHGGDRLFVSPDVADYLDELRELGSASARSTWNATAGFSCRQPHPKTPAGGSPKNASS
ncbi:MerR family transcriptional regulator [Nonomuraea wenchangensis]